MSKIRYAMTDDAVAKELGQRLAKLRVNANLTQDELADAIGVDRGRISRLERSGTAKLSTVISVLRHLDKLELLEHWLPEQSVASPLAQMKAALKQPSERKRARKTASTTRPPNKPEPEDLAW